MEEKVCGNQGESLRKSRRGSAEIKERVCGKEYVWNCGVVESKQHCALVVAIQRDVDVCDIAGLRERSVRCLDAIYFWDAVSFLFLLFIYLFILGGG
jgi:hypothetical protein